MDADDFWTMLSLATHSLVRGIFLMWSYLNCKWSFTTTLIGSLPMSIGWVLQRTFGCQVLALLACWGSRHNGQIKTLNLKRLSFIHTAAAIPTAFDSMFGKWKIPDEQLYNPLFTCSLWTEVMLTYLFTCEIGIGVVYRPVELYNIGIMDIGKKKSISCIPSVKRGRGGLKLLMMNDGMQTL